MLDAPVNGSGHDRPCSHQALPHQIYHQVHSFERTRAQQDEIAWLTKYDFIGRLRSFGMHDRIADPALQHGAARLLKANHFHARDAQAFEHARGRPREFRTRIDHDGAKHPAFAGPCVMLDLDVHPEDSHCVGHDTSGIRSLKHHSNACRVNTATGAIHASLVRNLLVGRLHRGSLAALRTTKWNAHRILADPTAPATSDVPADTLREQFEQTLHDSYIFERELGGGGMSRVFLAEEVQLGRRVVVKVLNPELAEGLSAERFGREVRLAARLQHPNVVPVLAAGQLASLPYYTMPFIDGASLRERLTSGALEIPDAVSVLRDVARALAYAHANGVVHRDIKPENVLLTGGAAVVADFGIAKAIAASASDEGHAPTLTALGTAIGTPAYMAPEQCAGDPAIDHRADLYAWGLLGWEVLTGQHPFADRRSPMELVGAHMTRVPLALTSVRAEVPAALSALIASCLAKDPADRPADAGMVLRALDAVMVTPAHAVPAAVLPVRDDTPSIAVLPFTNLSSSADDEYFSDGMTEEVISALGRLRGIRVAARRSSFAFKGKQVDLRTIAEQLGVRSILEGSVRRAGTRVRIAVQLVSAWDGLTLWSERYDRELADVFALQDDISQSIAAALEVRLTRATPGAEIQAVPVPRGAVDPDAYDVFLRGRFFFDHYQGPQALACFERAVELDPGFVLGSAWLGFASILGANLHQLPVESSYARGRAMGDRVRAMDPGLAEGMILGSAVALWYDWDRARAEALARQAIDVAPGFVHAYEFLAWSLLVARRFDEGIEVMEKGYALDPLSDFMLGHLILANLFAEQDERAVELGQRGVERSPASAPLHNLLGVALLATGRAVEARDVLVRGEALSPGLSAMPGTLAAVLAALGDREGARRALADLEAGTARGDVSMIEIACAYVWRGEEDAAFAAMERAVEARGDWMAFLHLDPRFRRVRGDPRFESVLRRIGMADDAAPSGDVVRRAVAVRRSAIDHLIGGSRVRRVVLLVVVAILLLVLALVLWRSRRQPQAARGHSIAVLSFVNMSNSAHDDDLSSTEVQGSCGASRQQVERVAAT